MDRLTPSPHLRPARARRPEWRTAIAAVIALPVALGLAACGAQSSADGSSRSSAGSCSSPKTLKVALGAVVADWGAFWVAEGRGLFAKNCVKVKVVNYNATAVSSSLLLSKQVDLVLNGVGSLLAVRTQGKPVELIYNLENF